MTEASKKIISNIQKVAIVLCALATIFTTSAAAIAMRKDNNKAKIVNTAGALLSGLGLGMTMGGYLSNPKRKRQRS